MDFITLVISFIVLMVIVCGIIIFFLHRFLVYNTEGAVNRLKEDINRANAKQAELTKKLKEADEELEKRRAEAQKLANQMREKAEEESKSEREKMINQAREEGEEIIAKAHNATEKLKEEMEREMDVRIVNYSTEILNDVLSSEAKGALDKVLVDEFLESLKSTDLSKISSQVKEMEVLSVQPVDDTIKNRISGIIKEKLNRDLDVVAKTDEKLGGGIVLKFGSMSLDGSIRNKIRQKGLKLVEKIESSA